MTKRKAPAKLPAKPPQSTAYYSESNDPAEIAKAMAENVDGWADMPDYVKAEIIALNIATNAMPNGPRMSVTENMVYQNDTNPQLHTMRLVKALGSSSGAFVTYILDRLATTLKASGGLNESSLNGALAFVNSFNPSNEAEAMLAVQMFVTNDAALRSLRTANAADWVDTNAQFTNLSVKLMRTFATQAEAMAKLQRGGVQTVKHIHVDNRGGQAVIAEQFHQGGANGKIQNQPYEPSAALPSQDAAGIVVPMSSYTGQEALPDSRRA